MNRNVTRAALTALAAENERVFGVHFPYPGIGRIVKVGDHFAFEPESLK